MKRGSSSPLPTPIPPTHTDTYTPTHTQTRTLIHTHKHTRTHTYTLSITSGMFHETWQLITTPQLLPPLDSAGFNSSPSASATHPQGQPRSSHQSHHHHHHHHHHSPQQNQHQQQQGQQQGLQQEQEQEQGSNSCGEKGSSCEAAWKVLPTYAPSISVRGVATVEDRDVLPRRALVAQLSLAEKESKV